MTEPRMLPPSLDRARRRLTMGDVGGARRDAEALLAAAPDNSESAAAHLILAACSEKSRDLTAALTHARTGVALTPRDPVVHYAFAEIQEATGDKLGAMASLRRAAELNPRFVQAHHYLGILLGESDDPQGALAAFTET